MINHLSFEVEGAQTTTTGAWNPHANVVPYDQATLTPTAEAAARFGAAASSVAFDVDEISSERER